MPHFCHMCGVRKPFLGQAVIRLTGKLKENVDKAENQEEAKKMIRNAGAEAGIILDDAELDQVSGGKIIPPVYRV